MPLLHVAVPLPQSCLASISNNVLLGYWLMNRLANFLLFFFYYYHYYSGIFRFFQIFGGSS